MPKKGVARRVSGPRIEREEAGQGGQGVVWVSVMNAADAADPSSLPEPGGAAAAGSGKQIEAPTVKSDRSVTPVEPRPAGALDGASAMSEATPVALVTAAAWACACCPTTCACKSPKHASTGLASRPVLR